MEITERDWNTPSTADALQSMQPYPQEAEREAAQLGMVMERNVRRFNRMLYQQLSLSERALYFVLRRFGLGKSEAFVESKRLLRSKLPHPSNGTK